MKNEQNTNISAVKYTFKNTEFDCEVKWSLPFSFVEAMTEKYAESVFVGDEYKPCRKIFYYRVLLISNYTNIDISSMSTDELFELCNDHGFYEEVLCKIDPIQRKLIYNCGEELINRKLNESPLHKIGLSINDTIKAFTGVIEKVDPDNLGEALKGLLDTDFGKSIIEKLEGKTI